MQFFRSLFSKTSYIFLNLSKEVVIAIFFIIFNVFYPITAQAGIFSFMTSIAGDKVSAKVPEAQDAPNSQTMGVLKAVVNSNPSPISTAEHPILASENALVAEIGPAGTASDVDETQNGEISVYVVRSGDTFSGIAKMFKVSVNTILWANDLPKDAVLKKDQTLVILPISGIRYTVKKGDTIKGIVAKYKADLDEVLNFNDLTLSSVLTPGDTIIVPDAEQATVTSPVKKTGGLVAALLRPLIGGYKSQGLHGHNGIDLAAPRGTAIRAAASGTVIISKYNGAWNGGYGNYIVISHPNGTQTLYAHNSKNIVAVGDNVARGQKIAEVGNTGHSTGDHLHFEVRGGVNPF